MAYFVVIQQELNAGHQNFNTGHFVNIAMQALWHDVVNLEVFNDGAYIDICCKLQNAPFWKHVDDTAQNICDMIDQSNKVSCTNANVEVAKEARRIESALGIARQPDSESSSSISTSNGSGNESDRDSGKDSDKNIAGGTHAQ